MIKKNSQETLSDKIAGILNTTPGSFDPEDEAVDETTARIEGDFPEENADEEQLLSKFRKQNINLLEDLDERYAGKKGSRKSLQESDEEHSSESEQSDEENLEERSILDKSDTDESEGSSDQESAETGDENDEEEENSDREADLDDDNTTKDETNFKHISDTNMLSQVKKGLCVRNQMSMWENLLEMRIQLQKCLITANKMPQKSSFTEIKKQCGPEFSSQVATAKKSLNNVLDKLLLLQKLVVKKYPETKTLDKVAEKDKNENEEDEEIASDTEDEKSVEDIEEDSEEVPRKKMRLQDFEREIDEQHNKYKNYRNSVIQKWNEKTRIAVMKNNTNSHSIINHIEHTLSDKSKLIKRTQLKRSEYKILDEDISNNLENSNEAPEEVRSTDEYNTEIFDDDDFYHQLLRELIEVKSADLTDPVQLGRQWIQLQNLRSKMKRKIDTRATKGRKIRYAVHTKLVNFMAPIAENSWTDEAKSELYNSLFGKNQFGVS